MPQHSLNHRFLIDAWRKNSILRFRDEVGPVLTTHKASFFDRCLGEKQQFEISGRNPSHFDNPKLAQGIEGFFSSMPCLGGTKKVSTTPARPYKFLQGFKRFFRFV